jgi:hypothetical protein
MVIDDRHEESLRGRDALRRGEVREEQPALGNLDYGIDVVGRILCDRSFADIQGDRD